ALVRQENTGWICGTGCLRVRVGRDADARFVFYVLGTSEASEWLLANAVGTNMLNLNTTILGRLPLAMPSVSEQQAIAEVLGALDDKIAANTALAAASIQLARHEFAARAKGIQVGPATFSDVADISGGGTPSTKNSHYWDGAVPWATPTDMTALSGPYLHA